MKAIIYHNTQCSKSREGLCILEEVQQDVEIREYLKNPLSFEEIEELLNLLEIKPLQLIRQKEDVFKEKYLGKKKSRKDWIKVMVRYPQLIERPIVVRGNRATIGRPPSIIKDFLSEN